MWLNLCVRAYMSSYRRTEAVIDTNSGRTESGYTVTYALLAAMKLSTIGDLNYR